VPCVPDSWCAFFMDTSVDHPKHSSPIQTRCTGHATAKGRRLALCILVVVIGAVYFSLSYTGVFYPPDEGATAYHFEKSVEGAIQHRDFYSVYGMAYYVLGKALFNLFGQSLIVLRTFALVLRLALAALIFSIGLRLVRPSFAFFGALGFIVWWGDPFIATPSYLYPAHVSQLLGLLSILFALSYLKNGRNLFVLLAGVAAGLSSLFKPNVGAFNLIALFLFFLVREMVRDLSDDPAESGAEASSSGIPIGRVGVMLEFGATAGVGMILLVLLGKFGFDAASFIFSLLPFYLAIILPLILGIKVLRVPGGDALLWKNQKDTIRVFFLLGGGFLFCQILQVAYFARHGALRDFLHMLNTATSYYSHYAIPFWGGASIVIACGVALLIALSFSFAIWTTADFGARWKICLASVAMLAAAALPAAWYVRQNIPARHHFTMWSIPLGFSLFASLFLIYRSSLKRSIRADDPEFSGLSLVTIFSATNLLDAYPKVDPGHFMMVMPPVLVLFAFLAQRFYDLWKGYLRTVLPRAGGVIAGALIGMIALGIFLPSLSMMVKFYALIIPTSDGGHRLYDGRLTRVPRYPAGIERAKGIAIHTFGDRHWPPLVEPKVRYFFEVAKRISEITQEDDKLFATTTSGLMLYFLADRDSMSDTANCYVWQTAMGTTTSNLIAGFSDQDLTRLVHTEKPRAIIVEEGDIETERFIANWPMAWSFIVANYRLSENVGPFQIYILRSQESGKSISGQMPAG